MPAALAIVLGGVDITTSVDLASVTMQLAGSQEIATCEFDVIDTTDTISATDEATLTVTEVGSSTVLFGGFVRSRNVVVIVTGRIIHITAVDYNSLLDRSIVVSDSRVAGESDHTRLVYLMTTYGTQFSSDYTQIATLKASMPAQKFVAVTLRQAIERVLGQASTKGSYYCDPTGRLTTYDRSVVTAAPFNLRVGTPGGGELAPETFGIENDASNLANAIYVVGATAAGSGWFTDVTSIATYGRRERFFNAPDADTAAKARQVGLAVLEDQKNPVPRGVFTTQSPKDGWRIGQSIQITSAQHGLAAAVYRIARVTARYLNPAGARDYTIEVGAPLPSLSTLLASAHGGGGGFPWHSPGGSGGWAPVLSGGGGGVSGGGGCACNTPYDAGLTYFDTFSRNVSGAAWGTSDAGTTWTLPFGSGLTTITVDGDNGRVSATSGQGTVLQTISADGPWTAATGFRMLATVGVDAVPSVGYADIGIYSDSGGVSLHISSDPGNGNVSIGSISVVKTDWAATEYYVGWEYAPSVHSRLKVWPTSSSEPASWLVTESPITSTFNTQLNIGMNDTGTGIPISLHIDAIAFGNPAEPTSGQPYPWTNLGVGNNVQTAFSTLTAFRAGSLEVRVDATTTTPASQTPATGAFTLPFPPSGIEIIWARWVVE